MKRLIASIGLALVAGSALAGGIPDSITTTKGETLTVPESIKKCMTCHLVGTTPWKPVFAGSQLNGAFGRPAGTFEGFSYGDDLKKGGWNWDEAHLTQWISKTTGGAKKAIQTFSGNPLAKTKMSFPGLNSEAEVQEVINFLKKL